MGRTLAAFAACVACALPVARASAQESINSATVSGRVADASGGVLPGASVTARQIETNVSHDTVADADGRFRFSYLPVGRYEIRVRLQGFAEQMRTLTLTVGSAFDVPITLALAGVDTTVTVSGDTTVLEAARSQIASTISQAEAQDAPLNGRNFLDLALLAPGVSPTNTGSTQLFAETSAVPGGGLSISSQRNLSNNFIVDGLSANDDAAGLSGMPYGVDAIDQFQVVTSAGQAELGRALGGYVSVVTRSGSNTFKGDGYGFFRDDALNAANALTKTVLPMSQQQFGASVGGPIWRDRTFYFANVERRNLDQSGLTTIAAPDLAAIQTQLAVSGYSGAAVTTGIYANPVRTTNVFAKADHLFNPGDQASLHVATYDVASSNARGAGGLSAPSASAALTNADRAVAASNVWSVTPRTVNETRIQATVSRLSAPPSDLVGPAVSIAGVAAFGTLSVSPTGRRNGLYEVVDNLSQQAGGHALRAGVDLLYNDDTITFPRADRGSYAFSSLANFLAGAYNNAGFTQTFGASSVHQTNPNVGVYAQDEWKAASNLTINAGLRYDLQFLQTIRTDTNNVAPRAGFAWVPLASRTLVIRGGAGLYYDRVPLRALANALLSAGNTTDPARLRQTLVTLSPGQAGAPAFPSILSAPMSSITLANLTTMDPAMKNAYSRQASLEIEQQIGRRSTVTLSYQHSTGRDLIAAINQNVPACVATGGNNGCRPNPQLGNISQYSPAGSSTYNGVTLSFVDRGTSWGHYRASYTFSKAMDDVGEFFFSAPIDPFDIMKDWGRSDDDQRHRVVLNGAVQTPSTPASTVWQALSHNLQLSATIQAYSSLPLNITSGLTTIQGTTARPTIDGQFIGRNTGVGPDLFNVNLRITRTFRAGPRARIDGMLEAFNLTNRVNAVILNGNFGAGAYPSSPSSSFGQITAVGDPRSLQLGFKVSF